MLEIKIDGLSPLTRFALNLKGNFRKARISTAKSLGYKIQRELRAYIEKGGEGWPSAHKLTETYYRKYKGNRWIKRSGRSSHRILYWLGKFARYRIDREGTVIQVDFGKSRKGQPGTFDKELQGIVARAEEGETKQVTKKVRLLWAKTGLRKNSQGKWVKKRNAQIGVNWFPLKKGTKTLEVPARPIFSKVFRKVNPRIMPYFDKKFWSEVEYYNSGRNKKYRVDFNL